ncbi:MAG: copper-binding protein [Sulfuritalea sp.]|jgi:Cu/Ag efflux protein CusF|nr:copper-binding protein [Sulfuritalea sp.]
MKTVISTASLVLALGFSAPGIAVAMDHSGHAAMPAQAPASAGAQMADGLVKKVDKSAGKVTVAHGPLPNLKMNAMTMVFHVKNAAWLDQMKEGDKIRLMAEKVNGQYTIVHFEAAK